jgi:hypothetical protein
VHKYFVLMQNMDQYLDDDLNMVLELVLTTNKQKQKIFINNQIFICFHRLLCGCVLFLFVCCDVAWMLWLIYIDVNRFQFVYRLYIKSDICVDCFVPSSQINSSSCDN